MGKTYRDKSIVKSFKKEVDMRHKVHVPKTKKPQKYNKNLKEFINERV
jgi:hypothetical protein